MIWRDVEQAFDRAAVLSFSKKKWVLTFPVLALCGVLFVFCRALSLEASNWIALSLLFLPILVSSGVLLALGVLIIRMYVHEAKRLSLSLRRLIAGSLNLIIGTTYLSVPPVLLYLCLWIAMGVFLLLQEIPGIGSFFGVIFAFAPFLLIFGALILCLFNLGLLFFVAPAAALQPLKRIALAKRALRNFAKQMFSSVIFFFIALMPSLLIGGLLYMAADVTNVRFLIAEHSLGIALEWFFIMLVFAAFLSPAVVFFFQFAAESYQLLQQSES